MKWRMMHGTGGTGMRNEFRDLVVCGIAMAKHFFSVETTKLGMGTRIQGFSTPKDPLLLLTSYFVRSAA